MSDSQKEMKKSKAVERSVFLRNGTDVPHASEDAEWPLLRCFPDAWLLRSDAASSGRGSGRTSGNDLIFFAYFCIASSHLMVNT